MLCGDVDGDVETGILLRLMMEVKAEIMLAVEVELRKEGCDREINSSRSDDYGGGGRGSYIDCCSGDVCSDVEGIGDDGW